jgi:hypothetical protein
MISCTEFILAYNELFKFLEERYGKEAAIDFWIGISDNFLQNLRKLVAEKGIQGMKEYWTHTLSEEGAKYKISATDNEFIIDMYKCPSVGILRRNRHIKRYPDYCKHCDLYRRVIEKFEFTYDIEYIDENLGKCRLTVRKKKS